MPKAAYGTSLYYGDLCFQGVFILTVLEGWGACETFTLLYHNLYLHSRRRNPIIDFAIYFPLVQTTST